MSISEIHSHQQQELTSVEPLIAGDWNVKRVPGWTEPVFVIVNGWFAVIPYVL